MKKYLLLCLLAGSAMLPLQTYANISSNCPDDSGNCIDLDPICVLLPMLPQCASNISITPSNSLT
ncbi:hypothetical protein [Xenorhabdus sp. GDc328]|uniref:hypothetical protein n=1 Tax=Xenorhabdus sp. GDc328 TaxID=742178 RepID=UPI000A860713